MLTTADFLRTLMRLVEPLTYWSSVTHTKKIRPLAFLPPEFLTACLWTPHPPQLLLIPNDDTPVSSPPIPSATTSVPTGGPIHH